MHLITSKTHASAFQRCQRLGVGMLVGVLVMLLSGCALWDALQEANEDPDAQLEDGHGAADGGDMVDGEDKSDAAEFDAAESDARDADGQQGNEDVPPGAPTIEDFKLVSDGVTVTATATVSGTNLSQITIDWHELETTDVSFDSSDTTVRVEESHQFSELGEVKIILRAQTSDGFRDRFSALISLDISREQLVGEWLFEDCIFGAATANCLKDTSEISGAATHSGICVTYPKNEDEDEARDDRGIKLNMNSEDGGSCGIGEVGYITLPSVSLDSNFTISMWVKPAVGSDKGVLLYHYHPVGDVEGYLRPLDDAWLRFLYGTDLDMDFSSAGGVEGGERLFIPGDPPIQTRTERAPDTDQWIHYAITAEISDEDEMSATIYKNGVVQAEAHGAQVDDPKNPNFLWYVGHTGMPPDTSGTYNGSAFRGRVDDIRFYNRSLTPGEIAALAVE